MWFSINQENGTPGISRAQLKFLILGALFLFGWVHEMTSSFEQILLKYVKHFGIIKTPMSAVRFVLLIFIFNLNFLHLYIAKRYYIKVLTHFRKNVDGHKSYLIKFSPVISHIFTSAVYFVRYSHSY